MFFYDTIAVAGVSEILFIANFFCKYADGK